MPTAGSGAATSRHSCARGRLDAGMAIVESKSARGDALADRVLRELGHRAQPSCSKYCLGVALTRPVAGNSLRPLLRRHFVVLAR